MKFVDFLGLPIAATTPDGVVAAVAHAATYAPTTFRLINAGTIDAARMRPDYWELLTGVGVNLPDGKPLASVCAYTAPPGLEVCQIRGPWLFEACLDQGRSLGLRHFLLGGSEDTLEHLRHQIAKRFPGAVVVGAQSPRFGGLSGPEVVAQDSAIRASGANIVWVALGTPKQDAEALRVLQSTGLTTVAVGAAFDFTAGTKRSAPAWVSRAHMEWLFRLIAEPRRLWRRYLFGNATFIMLAMRHCLSRHRVGS